MRHVIFTDLDGTLLDHASYDSGPAQPLLKRLKRLGVPVVMTTSKTLSEVAQLKTQLGNEDPAITENGAVVLLTDKLAHDLGLDEPVQRFGPDYHAIREIVESLPQELRQPFLGFGDCSDDKVAELTGLSVKEAALAKRREGSEPFLWQGDDAALPELAEAMGDYGLIIITGGRFHHLAPNHDKAAALRWLSERLNAQSEGEDIQAIALGDGPNDASMLAAAQIGVIMPNPHGRPVGLEHLVDGARLRLAPAPGPEGWALAVEQILFSEDTSP